MKTQPNIVFFHVDQWRGDCLSIEKHPVVHTPYLDRLASNGVRLTKAYAACPTCIPARASLMTGLTPEHHGRVGYKDGVPWNYPVTLGGEFTRQGYRTHAVGKLHAYPERNKLGFETVELHDGYVHFSRNVARNPEQQDDYLDWLRKETGRADADYYEHGVNCNSIVARPWPMEEYLHPTNWVVSRGLEFLRTRDQSKPFFLYLSFHRPHPPYDPPAWAYEQYRSMEMPYPVVGDWAGIFEGLDRSDVPDAHRAVYRKDILQRGRAGYYGHMSHIDHQINRFVEGLYDYDLLENSWIIFTSDHGEMLGDHHLFRKGYPYEGSARLPLIMRPPAAVDMPRGGVCDTVVELRDIMPTLLDAAGLDLPESIDGRSFLPQAKGASRDSLRPWLHGEHTIFGNSMQWLTDGREKYIWHSGDGREQLFDLESDPGELKDLAMSGRAEERVALWRERLVGHLKGREEGFVQEGRLISGRKVTPVLKTLSGQS